MSAFLWWVVYSVAVVVPLWKLLPKYGVPAYAALLAAMPIVLIGFLWLMAFADKLNLSGNSDPAEG